MNPTLLRTLTYFKPYWKLLVVSAICSSMVGGMDGAFSYLVAPVLNKIFTGKETGIFLFVPLGIIALFVIRGLARFTYDSTIQLAGQKAIQDIRNEVYAATIRMDMAFFNKRTTGELMSHATNDINTMQAGMANVVCGLFRELFSACSLLGVIFYRNWHLAIFSFVVIPMTAYPGQLIGKNIKRASRKSLEVMGGLTSMLQESFSGIKVIKAFGLTDNSIERFRITNRDYFTQLRKYIKYDAMAMPVSETIISFGIAAVVYFGGRQVMSGRMTPSELLSFITAMVLVFNPIKKLQSAYNAMQRSAGAAERVFQLLDEPRKVVERPNAISMGRSSGTVEFRNVSFAYGEERILSDISLKAANNRMIALVGPSGSGKSTLVSLLARFYDVTEGSILIDGHDIRDITLKSLISQIALVDQETTLFHESIANNIRYGKPDATMEEVMEAATAAYAHEFIQQLPEGYDTSIGDRGVRLSGGQRQRICIARALLKNAPILILDEATSALDTESEQMVQQALDNLMLNRTTFVIAHRLSTVQNADTIVVLDGGHLVECGSHDALMANNGLYSRLHDLQFNGKDYATGNEP